MIVEKIITTQKQAELDITGATLLSINEAENLLTEKERIYDNWWWLRSPGSSQDGAAHVRSDGSVCSYGNYVDNAYGCVRPALKILNLEFSDLELGDVFIFGDKPFKIISDELAFCLDDIGTSYFRKNYNADDANDYEKSDIKKLVDKWFDDACK